MKFTFLSLLLFNLRQMSIVIGEGLTPPHCCLYVSDTKVTIGDLLDYYSQDTPLCSIKAIRFRTKKNKTICSDPEDKWAKKAITELNKRHLVTTMPYKDLPMCNIKTSTDIPAISKTIPTAGPKTEINTSSVIPKNIKTTAIKTARPETVISTSTATTVPTVPSTVTTFKTSTRLQTETRTTTTKPTTVSTKSLKSSANPCSAIPKRTRKTTGAPRTTVTSTTKDRVTTTAVKIIFSTKYKIIRWPKKTKKRGKGKTALRRIQMRLGDWDKAKNN